VLFFIVIIPWARIFSKAGYNPVWSIFMVIPFVGLIAIWFFAFSDWKVEKRKTRD